MVDKFVKLSSEVLAAGTPIAIGSLIGGPVGAIPAAVLSSIVEMGAQTCMNKIYDDITCRQLSSIQLNRVEQVLHHAQKAYYELIEKQGWVLSHPESEAYVLNHLETCEHTVLNAINETQSKKIPYEGYLWASKFNSTEIGFDDFHMMASILLKMTWRELVLVGLISEGFFETIQDQHITNPVVCVEIYDLVTWGLVKPAEGWIIENNSAPVPVNDITITRFGIAFSKALLLEKITEEEKETIKISLNLQESEEESINRIRGISEEEINKMFEGKREETIEAATPKWAIINAGSSSKDIEQ